MSFQGSWLQCDWHCRRDSILEMRTASLPGQDLGLRVHLPAAVSFRSTTVKKNKTGIVKSYPNGGRSNRSGGII